MDDFKSLEWLQSVADALGTDNNLDKIKNSCKLITSRKNIYKKEDLMNNQKINEFEELKKENKELKEKIIALEIVNTRLKEENEKLHLKVDQLKSQISIDPLTGALNKCAIGDLLEAEVGYARRAVSPLSLIFLDIDFFKKINEEFGHLAGDTILVELVKRLQYTLRRYDKIGRFGGEEFIVVLRGTNLRGAEAVANRLRRIVALEPFKYEKKEIKVTISLGVAERQPTEMAFSLIRAADDAMLQAKHNGRNCVVINKRECFEVSTNKTET